MTDTAMPWLRFHCSEDVGGHTARYQFTLRHEWTCIFGPSGSGKTTLLRLLAGLLPQHGGECRVHGRDLRSFPTHRRSMALVDQNASVFPHRNVRDNVAFALRSAPSQRDARLQQCLNQFDLTALANSSPATLSGGEAHRVVLARAVAAEPDVLLLDESFAGLDRAIRERLCAVLRTEQAERAQAGRPMPIVSVTHDVAEVFATAQEVLRITDGHVVTQGTPGMVLSQERQALLQELQS